MEVNIDNYEIDRLAYSDYKKARKEHIKIDNPKIKDEDLEKEIEAEWACMDEETKLPYITKAMDMEIPHHIVNKNEKK